MTTIILLSVLAPTLAGVAFLTLRNRRPELLADVRGIALQTVIIIVVLLAIAGAVAGVLITRGSDAVEQLQGQDISTALGQDQYDTKTECETAGFFWHVKSGTEVATGCFTLDPEAG